LTFSSSHRHSPVLTLALLGLILAGALAAPLALAGRHRSPAAIDSVERSILHRINSYRHQHGLRSVRLDNRMNIGANQHSRSMARRGYFAHASADGSSWDGRVRHYSRSRFVGEVIGWTSHTSPARQARLMVSTWVHSAPHRRVLLTRGFSRIGVARMRGGSWTYFTADFAGRRH
jgi:uncharacterized protein YkwD